MAANKWILAAVFLIIGAIFAAQLPAAGVDRYTKTIVTDEVIDTSSAKLGLDYNASVNLGPIANVPTTWKINDCPLTSIVVTNASGTALTVTTDYTLSTTTGVLNLLNTTDNTAAFTGSNNSLVDYTYCSDDYVNLAWGRTAIQLTYGFFALGCFGIALALMYSIWKESGVSM